MIDETEIAAWAAERWGEKTPSEIALKYAEESGEVAGALIKLGEGRASDADLRDEIGDALLVLAQLAEKFDWTLEECQRAKWDKLNPPAGGSDVQFLYGWAPGNPDVIYRIVRQ